MNAKQVTLRNQMLSPFKFFSYCLTKLPSLVFWGVKMKALDDKACTISTKYNWRNTNPFGSMYFSALCGSAELATGMLVMMQTNADGQWSMLVTGFEAKFKKKAMGTINFICNEGSLVQATTDQMRKQAGSTGNVSLKAVGINEAGEEVGEFLVHWSLKYKG